MDRKALDVNGGGVIDFYQRFQQLQLQRDTSDELIKVCHTLRCTSLTPQRLFFLPGACLRLLPFNT